MCTRKITDIRCQILFRRISTGLHYWLLASTTFVLMPRQVRFFNLEEGHFWTDTYKNEGCSYSQGEQPLYVNIGMRIRVQFVNSLE